MADVLAGFRVPGDDNLRLRGNGLDGPVRVKKALHLLHENVTDDRNADEEPGQPNQIDETHKASSHQRSARDQDGPELLEQCVLTSCSVDLPRTPQQNLRDSIFFPNEARPWADRGCGTFG